ncbi:MAG: DUF2163 domain-containing protein [Bacteroidales bacterium]|nr:DUF2163 domain-containing protein [Bacteroidales bacterium]
MSDFPLLPEWSTKPDVGSVDDLFFDPLDAGSPAPWLVYKKRDTFGFHYKGNRDQLQSVLVHFAQNSGRMGSSGGFKVYTPETVSDETAHVKTVRYRDDTLSVELLSANYFEFDIDFIEANIGPKPDIAKKIAYLYTFNFKEETYRVANWGYSLLDVDGNTYLAGDVTHSSVEFSEGILGEELTLNASGYAREWLLRRVHGVDKIEITVARLEVDASLDPTPQYLFKGVVVNAETGLQGEATFTLSSNLNALQRGVGRKKLQRQCNHILYSAECGAVKEEITGTIERIDGRKIDVTSDLHNDEPDKFFNGATLTQDGKNYIVLKDVKKDVGGVVYRTLTIERIPSLNELETVSLTLWCDKTIQCCAAKFKNSEEKSNAVNFGGCPWLPNNNPLDLARNDQRGKK